MEGRTSSAAGLNSNLPGLAKYLVEPGEAQVRIDCKIAESLFRTASEETKSSRRFLLFPPPPISAQDARLPLSKGGRKHHPYHTCARSNFDLIMSEPGKVEERYLNVRTAKEAHVNLLVLLHLLTSPLLFRTSSHLFRHESYRRLDRLPFRCRCLCTAVGQQPY